MTKSDFIIQLKKLSTGLVNGDSIISICSSFDGNWENIVASIKNGNTLSESINNNPFPCITNSEHTLLVELVHCGELGGVLEICLDRFTEFVKTDMHRFTVREYLNTLGLMMSCGVPVLTAIQKSPIDVELQYIRKSLYESIQSGNSIMAGNLFEKFLTEAELRDLSISEQNGYLPEFLWNLKHHEN